MNWVYVAAIIFLILVAEAIMIIPDRLPIIRRKKHGNRKATRR